jgi:hypothetical protein
VSPGAPSAAAAGGPACGDTIVTSTKLHADLTDCPGDGLIIGADGITLDLKGHTIDGDAVSGGDDTGVRIDGHDGVVVKHGTIQEFDHALHLTGAGHNEISHVFATRNGDEEIGRAILLDEGSDWNRIVHNDASSNGRSGVAVLDGHHNLVAHNRTATNGVAGMGIFGGSDNVVIANAITDNADNGIFWGAGTTGGRFAGNRVTGNPGGGFAMEEADGATVAHNLIARNGDNVIVFGSGNLIRANAVLDAAGCDDGCGYGVSVEGGTGNVVSGNLVLGGAHDGIRLDTFAPDDLPTTDTIVEGNLVRGAGIDGISVGTETDNPVPGARIAFNAVSRAGDDGIDVRRAGTLISRNRADRNGDLGIFAAPGAIDGGGNRAHGNGNPAECVGVVCR